ncbi:hypothetical protein NEOKW01_0899 [Nematocida sp. AWRm80]|nr:hypothetical protein NEOKW01_0899 [Nematocida sp. AWRm80]
MNLLNILKWILCLVICLQCIQLGISNGLNRTKRNYNRESYSSNTESETTIWDEVKSEIDDPFALQYSSSSILFYMETEYNDYSENPDKTNTLSEIPKINYLFPTPIYSFQTQSHIYTRYLTLLALESLDNSQTSNNTQKNSFFYLKRLYLSNSNKKEDLILAIDEISNILSTWKSLRRRHLNNPSIIHTPEEKNRIRSSIIDLTTLAKSIISNQLTELKQYKTILDFLLNTHLPNVAIPATAHLLMHIDTLPTNQSNHTNYPIHQNKIHNPLTDHTSESEIEISNVYKNKDIMTMIFLMNIILDTSKELPINYKDISTNYLGILNTLKEYLPVNQVPIFTLDTDKYLNSIIEIKKYLLTPNTTRNKINKIVIDQLLTDMYDNIEIYLYDLNTVVNKGIKHIYNNLANNRIDFFINPLTIDPIINGIQQDLNRYKHALKTVISYKELIVNMIDNPDNYLVQLEKEIQIPHMTDRIISNGILGIFRSFRIHIYNPVSKNSILRYLSAASTNSEVYSDNIALEEIQIQIQDSISNELNKKHSQRNRMVIHDIHKIIKRYKKKNTDTYLQCNKDVSRRIDNWLKENIFKYNWYTLLIDTIENSINTTGTNILKEDRKQIIIEIIKRYNRNTSRHQKKYYCDLEYSEDINGSIHLMILSIHSALLLEGEYYINNELEGITEEIEGIKEYYKQIFPETEDRDLNNIKETLEEIGKYTLDSIKSTIRSNNIGLIKELAYKYMHYYNTENSYRTVIKGWYKDNTLKDTTKKLFVDDIIMSQYTEMIGLQNRIKKNLLTTGYFSNKHIFNRPIISLEGLWDNKQKIDIIRERSIDIINTIKETVEIHNTLTKTLVECINHVEDLDRSIKKREKEKEEKEKEDKKSV